MLLDESTAGDGARAMRHLAIEHAVARTLAASTTIAEAIPPILETLGRGLEWTYAAYWSADLEAGLLRRDLVWTGGTAGETFATTTAEVTFARGTGMPGRVWATGAPVWVRDIDGDLGMVRRAAALAAGLRSAIGFPVVVDGQVIAVLELLHPQIQELDAEVQAMAISIGTQLGQFVANRRSHQRLADKRRRLELALEAGRLGSWEWDIRTGKVHWSPAVEAMYGLPTGSFGGSFEEYQRVLHPDDRERVLAQVRRAVEERRDHHVEHRILRPDGAVRWIEGRGRFVLDDSGVPIRLVGISTDVTEQKEALIALQLSEARHAATLMSVGDAVIATDGDGRITLMNGVAEELTGWSVRDALGRPLDDAFQIVDEVSRQPVASPVAEVLRERAIVGLAEHTVLLRPDGTEVAIDDSAAPIRGADGAIVGVVLVFRDVSDKRQEEARRRFVAEANQTLGSSLDYKLTLATVARLAVPRVVDWCAVDVVDLEGAIERVAVAHVDPAKVELAEELARRYPPDPDTGAIAVAIRTGESSLIREISDDMLTAVARGPEHLRLIRELGLRSYMIVPLRVEGRVLGAISFVSSRRLLGNRDLQLAEELAHAAAIAIDHARLYEQAHQARLVAEAARAQAEIAMRGREDLLAIVSHDLRNPLGSILNSAALVERLDPSGEIGKKARKYADIISRSAHRMNRLIADLLDLSSLERGALRIEPQRHDAGTIIADSVEMFAPMAAAKPVHLTAVRTSESLCIRADRERVLQVLSNLVGNALKFTPADGQITLAVERDGPFARFSVTDTGPGIVETQQPHIFDRYWKGSAASHNGVGLGLSIAKGLVEAQHGTISVRSRPAAGTTFTFTMPLDP